VFAGEYAAQTAGQTRADNRNNWRGAIAEAAFMTGLERNGDVVEMASYAPLLAHADAWQWTPDAIWFDNLRAYGTPNYYVQKIFAANTGTRVVPATPRDEGGFYTSAVEDERTHELIVKVVNATATARTAEIRLDGVSASGTAKVWTLGSANLEAENSFEHPRAVAPVESTAEVKAGKIAVELGPYSVNVFRVTTN
jgi:alpha-N-arabinofuranosidase